MDFKFYLESILLGIALAMDAFSVSLANGLAEPAMKQKKATLISGVFSFFQFAMPFIGWVLVTTVARLFGVFEKFIPWIALVLLSYLGIKMLIDGFKKSDDNEASGGFKGPIGLLVQGIATSIDALSVGFTISNHNFIEALVACLLIGAVTFVICLVGVNLGRKAGGHFSGNKAGILGGVILIAIGIEIFVSSFF